MVIPILRSCKNNPAILRKGRNYISNKVTPNRKAVHIIIS